jgi:hypothetical protein
MSAEAQLYLFIADSHTSHMRVNHCITESKAHTSILEVLVTLDHNFDYMSTLVIFNPISRAVYDADLRPTFSSGHSPCSVAMVLY